MVFALTRYCFPKHTPTDNIAISGLTQWRDLEHLSSQKAANGAEAEKAVNL